MHSPNSMMASCSRSTRPVPLQHYSFGLWLTSILLFTAATTPTTNGCIEGERDALLDFKTGLVGGPSGRLSSWRGRVDCCRWSGVVCDNGAGHVVELNLQNSDPDSYEMPIEGEIRPSLLLLTHLERLYLSHNDFGGIQIPEFFGSLTKLTYLDLSWSNFSGAIPAQLGNMSSLRYLDLSDNSLFGPIPAGIGNLTGLKELYLRDNSLSGHIPIEIGELPNLTVLSLSNNSLEGTMSELHFSNLAKLRKLDLSKNSIAISVDHNWVPPFQLRSIKLNSCKLGPTFPRWLRSQNSIEDLDMSNTSIEDVLPDWFWNNSSSSSSSSINLSQNRINGTLPTSLEHMRHLRRLELSSNMLEGLIPRVSPFLSYLDLSNNSFLGSLPPIIRTLDLQFLDLSYNHINGSISSFICNCELLHIINLSDNQISGEIPWCWQEANFFVYINLANNKLSGEIPSTIGNLTGLRSLHLNNNSLQGHLPLSLKNCSGLVVLDLGDNNFSGSIPKWIAQNLQNLTVLRLCSNMFSGNIPAGLGQLHHLHVIDLANNKLSGPIPCSFGNLSAAITSWRRHLTSGGNYVSYRSLNSYHVVYSTPRNRLSYQYFDDVYVDSITLTTKGKKFIFSTILYLVNSIDLSSNNLTGEILVEIGFVSALQTLNLSKNNFVGHIPATIGGMKSLETLDLSFNELSGSIPQSLSGLNFLNHLNLSYNNLSGAIPSGNQLQTLNDSSIYIGNAYLCGAPLAKSCYNPESNNVTKDENNKDGSAVPSDYLSIILGYLIGLWSVFIILLFKENWRVFYFRMFDKMYDKAYVAIKIRIARLTTTDRG